MEKIEYVYDPKTKRYILVETSASAGERYGDTLRALGSINPITGPYLLFRDRERILKEGSLVPERYKESLSVTEVAALLDNEDDMFKQNGRTVALIPRGRALKPEYRKAEKAGKRVKVDPVTMKPLTKDKSITTDMSTPFVTLKDRELSISMETGLVTPIKKANERDKDVPPAGYYLSQKNPTTGQEEMTLIGADQWRYNLTKQFLSTPEEVSIVKQKLKDAGLWNAEIDNRLTPEFWTRLQGATAEASIDNYFRFQAKAPGRDLIGYLDSMAMEGGAGGTTTKTQVSLSTENELYGALNQEFQRYTGRRVPDNVLQEFVQRVNALERQSPTVQTTTGDNTTVTGGSAGIAEREAVQFAREQKGAGAFRGATYYMDALMEYVNRDQPGF